MTERESLLASPLATVTIYGASDDLVEIEGDINEEFYATDEGEMCLLFGDGTVLDIEYDRHGIWRITGKPGSATMTKEEATADEGDRPDGKPAYSDIVTLTGDLKWCAGAEHLLFHKIEAAS